MKLKAPYQSTFDSIRRLAIEITDLSEASSAEDLAGRATGGLADLAGVALARLWLLRPGETCPRCDPDVGPPLHLMASAGSPRASTDDWTRRDGPSSCLGLGRGKIGHIVSKADPIHIEDGLPTSPWIAAPEWARREDLRGFGGQPLMNGSETTGALAVFTRTSLPAEAMGWLRMIADHAALGLANLSVVESLRNRTHDLEEENRRLRETVRSELREGILEAARSLRASPESTATAPTPPAARVLKEREMRRLERNNLIAAMEQTGGRVAGKGGAAELLGVKPTTLASRLKTLGLANLKRSKR